MPTQGARTPASSDCPFSKLPGGEGELHPRRRAQRPHANPSPLSGNRPKCSQAAGGAKQCPALFENAEFSCRLPRAGVHVNNKPVFHTVLVTGQGSQDAGLLRSTDTAPSTTPGSLGLSLLVSETGMIPPISGCCCECPQITLRPLHHRRAPRFPLPPEHLPAHVGGHGIRTVLRWKPKSNQNYFLLPSPMSEVTLPQSLAGPRRGGRNEGH